MTDQTNTKPQPGTPEYDAAMIAKAETSGVTASHTDANGNTVSTGAPPPAPSDEKPKDEKPTDDKPERPEWCPEKFWTGDPIESAKKIAASYSELEKQNSKPKDEKSDEPKDGEGEPKGDEPPPLQALSERATEELAKDGKLSTEVYEGYEKAGISRAQVDAYVAGVRAIGELRVREAHDEVGGRENYQAMQAWANATLTEAEQQSFNETLFNGDDGARLNAIRGLKARFEAENGRTGQLVKPRASSETLQGEMFRSRAEMTKAMRDPQYKTDAAFRADVERKILNATNAGIELF
jgi:hypothetical protein